MVVLIHVAACTAAERDEGAVEVAFSASIESSLVLYRWPNFIPP
jgi:hypothetical protein